MTDAHVRDGQEHRGEDELWEIHHRGLRLFGIGVGGGGRWRRNGFVNV